MTEVINDIYMYIYIYMQEQFRGYQVLESRWWISETDEINFIVVLEVIKEIQNPELKLLSLNLVMSSM